MATPAPLPAQETAPPVTRIRLIALALAGWHDHVRIPVSRVRGESGSGEPTTISGRPSTRRRDELLLRLEGQRDESSTLTAIRSARRPGDLERGSHPCWAALDDAMSVLAVRDPDGHRLLVNTLVAAPLPGLGWRYVRAAIEALPFIAGGGSRAVSTPKYRLIRSLHELDQLLPSNLAFPREVHEQVSGWEEWRQAMRATPTAKRGERGYRAALRLQDAHIRELHDLAGWGQARIAAEFGISQQAVSKSLSRTERKSGP